jgi:hypothetical protein
MNIYFKLYNDILFKKSFIYITINLKYEKLKVILLQTLN